MSITVSVIIPVYNVEKYLSDCLKSVLEQTLRDIEVLCIEDCSTDDSLAVLQKYAEQDERITIIRNTVNKGLAASRNIGVEHAAGDYIYFLDSDDMISPEALAVLFNLASKEALDVIYFNTKEVKEDSNSQSVYLDKHKINISGLYSGSEIFSVFMEQDDWDGCVWRQFYRRKLIFHKCYFREGMVHEDIAFSIRAALEAKRVMYLDKRLHVYRRRCNSITAEITPVNILGVLYAYFDVLNISMQADVSDSRLGNALNGRLLQLYNYIRYMYRQCADIEEIYTLANLPILHLLYVITKDIYQGMFPRKISLQNINYIKNFREIIIYGAGKVGLGLFELLKDLNIDILGFAVSDMSNNVSVIMQKKVKVITDWMEFRENALVIVAVKDANQIPAKLGSLGYRHVLKLF